ncbi:MAG TPA: DUF4329 domain-containing protein [Chthoniobacterales bacterium]|nr:DUF4329 domain-containing protein [Chthoniobacterales bacterium]
MYSGSTPPGKFVWFGYDPLGRCVKRWLAPDNGESPEPEGGYAPGTPNPVATYLYYDGWNLVQEGTAPNSPTRLYVHGGRVDEVVAQINPENNTLRCFQYDAQGHCTFQTDTSGQIMEQYEYDAFGLPYFFDGSGHPTTLANGQPGSLLGNRILFTGREYLSDMRIYDFRNRVYHPELGRFLQPDPKHFEAGDYNLYRYCHNDPINKTDPMGLAPGDPYATRDAAATDAMTDIARISVQKDLEFGGELYLREDGKFSYTAPREGGQHNSPMLKKIPNYEGYYHSHGKESGPKYDGENFSGKPNDHLDKKSDKKLADDTQKPGYLVTPSGEMKRYDPDPDKQRNGPVTTLGKLKMEKNK